MVLRKGAREVCRAVACALNCWPLILATSRQINEEAAGFLYTNDIEIELMQRVEPLYLQELPICINRGKTTLVQGRSVEAAFTIETACWRTPMRVELCTNC